MPGFLNENIAEIGKMVLRCLLQIFCLELRDILFQMWLTFKRKIDIMRIYAGKAGRYQKDNQKL